MVEPKPKTSARKLYDVPLKKNPRRSEEGLRSKKESDRRRGQTRITIGSALPRWRALKTEQRLRSDTDVALLLLDIYERYTKGPIVSAAINAGNNPQPPLPSSLSSTESQRGKECQQDDVEHQNETTHKATEVDWLQDSFEEMEVTIDEDECNSVKDRLSDLDSDMENVVEAAEQSAPGAEDSCDEDVYVPIIPQRSTTSELLLECEEEELEPWQKQTSHIQLKDEDDDGELTAQQQLFHKVATLTVKPEASDQISNNPVSSSSVQSPAVYTTSSNQLQPGLSISETLPVHFSLPCFTVLKLESTGTSKEKNN